MMCKFPKYFPVCALLLLAFTTSSAQVASHAPTVFKQPPPTDPALTQLKATGKPLVRINGVVLTDTDLVREEYAIFPYAKQHNGIPKDMEPQIRQGAMQMIIFEELVYQEAVRRKMTISSAKMQKAETDFRKQFPTPDDYSVFLKSEFNGSEAVLREKIKRSLLIEAFLNSEVDSKSNVTPAEVKAYYDNNNARFSHPESYIFQTISVLPPANATADQLKEGRTRAENAFKQAKATKTAEEFGLLAEKISDDDYRVMMGQHKAMPVNELAPPVLKALAAMKPGDVSDLIQLNQAYTILRLNEHVAAGKAKFDAALQAALTKELQKNKNNQLRSALDKKLRQNAKVEML